jgi:hypothetical protein
MSARYVVKLTMEQAEKLGIVKCAHCGYPPNNHFDWSPRPCAHDNSCPGYKASFRMGSPIHRKRRS